jgi:hypothetical protein
MALVLALMLTHWAVLALVTASGTRSCHWPLLGLQEQLCSAALRC